uniref:tripartite tricarboxylate transporter substrate-binding protein n=1 Tax=uncultured Aeromicrobium sp. TaxID=337820 RepID=UPI0025E2E93F
VVRDDSEHESLTDVVGEASSGMVRVGVAGQDGPDAVTLQLLAAESGGDFRQVVFQSGAESVTALLAGDIDMAILNPNEVAGQLESADVRALAVFSEERYPEDSFLGEVPTATEQGVDVSLGQLRGVVAPPGLTDAQQRYWVDLVEEYTRSPEYDAYVEASLMLPRFLAGEEFADYMAEQEELLRKVIGQ